MTTKQRTTTSFKSTRKTAKQTRRANRPTQRSAERDIIDAKRKTDDEKHKNQALSPKIHPREQRLTTKDKPKRNPHKMGKTYSKPKQNQ
jgi:hypothetical protein